MTVLIHPFEKAGLGKAPFKFVGMREIAFVIPGVMNKAGGSCDYCGTGIRWACDIVGADGKRFKVGTDCVRKVHAKGTPLLNEMELAMKNAKAAVAAKKAAVAAEKLAARVKVAETKLEAAPELLKGAPHPFGFGGKTLRDYVEFLLRFGGAAGRTKACKFVETA